VAMDRTSCSRFTANQLRLLFSVAAYVLFQVLQSVARTTARSLSTRMRQSGLEFSE
jgi:hypothetical protein